MATCSLSVPDSSMVLRGTRGRAMALERGNEDGGLGHS